MESSFVLTVRKTKKNRIVSYNNKNLQIYIFIVFLIIDHRSLEIEYLTCPESSLYLTGINNS